MTGLIRIPWPKVISLRVVSFGVISNCTLALVAATATTLAAQDRTALVAKAGEQWLASDQTDRRLLSDTIGVLLLEPIVGLDWLGRQLPAADKASAESRSKGVHGLCTQVTLEFLRVQQKCGMVFVGQYRPLERLQPFVGEFLFGLLLQTPPWYPLTFRVRLVPALRDLQVRQPSIARLDAIIEIIEDDREPQDLRWALAAMLWQWDNQKFARSVVAELLVATTEGDAEDRVQTTLQLADYYCLLRDYRSSARAHRSAQVLAKGAEVALQPIAWYSAACVHALLGEREKGIAALARCARMHASPHLDSSLRLERELFEKDPEIALLREDERFAGLLELAFGPVDGNKDGGNKDGVRADGSNKSGR